MTVHSESAARGFPAAVLPGPVAGGAVLAVAWPWLMLAVAGGTLFYWQALASLGAAWQRPEYSYGPLVPLITAFMVLRELQRRPLLPDSGSRAPGLALVLLGLLLGLAGNAAEIADIATYGLILAIGGFILILAGPRQGLRFWPGWVHLVFMLPLPEVLYLHASTTLQDISARIGVGIIDALGIPVLLDGSIIDLGTYQLQVAEACSGLAYLFPMLSFGWLLALLYIGPNWHRGVIFLAAIPVAILMNALRIAVVGILVNHYGIAQAQGFLHFFEGWVIFMAATAVLYVVAMLLQRVAAGGRRYPGVLDLSYHGVWHPLRRLPELRASPALAASAMLLILSGVLWLAQPGATPAPVERKSFVFFPTELGSWRGASRPLDAATLQTLSADDHLNARFARGSEEVDLLLTFYTAQTGARSGVHSPAVCLPAGGWDVSQWSRKPVAIGGEIPHSLIVNRAVIQKGLERRLVYYWFEQRGRQMPGEYAVKLRLLQDAITTGRSDGGLVRLVTPIAPGEDATAAEARLDDIMQQLVPVLPNHFPPT
jgi:exosortase D (VPLPA-CTERM-specific)